MSFAKLKPKSTGKRSPVYLFEILSGNILLKFNWKDLIIPNCSRHMVTISTQAQIAIRSLLPSDKERVKHLIALLEHFPQDEYIRQQARRLKGNGLDNLYIMRVTHDLRLLFRYSQGVVEILDIVTHARLEKIHG
jgi:Txe/YoeB family toxin of Txe-Axe toxin-antitoxin module